MRRWYTIGYYNSQPWGLIGKNMAYIDTNNCPWAEDFLIDNDFGIPTGEYKASGFCVYPLYQLDLEKIGKYNLTK